MAGDKNEAYSVLHAFCYQPKIYFEEQWEGEKVILLLRAHPFTQLKWLFNCALMMVLLIVVNFLFSSYLSLAQNIVFNIAVVIFIFSYAWLNFLRWVYTVGIITDKRIIDVDFTNILYKEITAVKYGKVSDVTARVGGYFGSLFQFGTVFVKTEGGVQQNVEFDNIPNPTEAVKIINNLAQRH